MAGFHTHFIFFLGGSLNPEVFSVLWTVPWASSSDPTPVPISYAAHLNQRSARRQPGALFDRRRRRQLPIELFRTQIRPERDTLPFGVTGTEDWKHVFSVDPFQPLPACRKHEGRQNTAWNFQLESSLVNSTTDQERHNRTIHTIFLFYTGCSVIMN